MKKNGKEFGIVAGLTLLILGRQTQRQLNSRILHISPITISFEVSLWAAFKHLSSESLRIKSNRRELFEE